MCGIAGYIGAPGDDAASAVRAMLSQERHRGPDDEGIALFGAPGRRAILGSQRLAILDLSANGHMPMVDPRLGNAIVHNGEIYNYRELRADLERRGYAFRSDTDTEVILAAYEVWGTACVERFRGMFAFAIWDEGRREVLVARDRAGEKPFYFATWDGKGIAFASEVRALLASGLMPSRLSRVALESYLYNGFSIDPNTLVESIQSLPAAHWMRLADDGSILEKKRYWGFPAGSAAFDRAKVDDLVESVRGSFLEAVRLRLRSDVPLGAFLSGGLDSSMMVAAMARYAADVRTFSIGFAEKSFDESPYAAKVAEHFGTRHTAITVDGSSFAERLDDAIDAMDLPTFDGLNTYFVARAAKEYGLTVALAGLGADELFGGYPFFRQAPLFARLHSLIGARHGRSQLCGAFSSAVPFQVAGLGKIGALAVEPSPVDCSSRSIAAYQAVQSIFPRWTQRFLSDWGNDDEAIMFGLSRKSFGLISDSLPGMTLTENLSALAFQIFLGNRCLRDADAMSMAVSLEMRTPFTDHVFIEALARIPSVQRTANAPNKPLEWNIAEPLLEGALERRPKQGFIFPFSVWLRTPEMAHRIRDTLLDGSLAKRLGFRPSAIERFLRAYRAYPGRIPWSRPWTLYVLFQWCARHGATL